jgi:alkyldihydroxyacetonephosphate synthase
MRLDPVSLLLICPLNVSLKEIEKYLNRKGCTLGYKPASANGLSLRKALERRIPNLYALRYGEIDDLAVSLKVKMGGKTVVTRNVPRAATGPDFKKIFIGSRGQYGKILEATLRVVPIPETRERWRIRWRDAKGRDRFLALLGSSGIRPSLLRLRNSRSIEIGLEGLKEIVQAERKCLKSYARETKGKMRSN